MAKFGLSAHQVKVVTRGHQGVVYQEQCCGLVNNMILHGHDEVHAASLCKYDILWEEFPTFFLVSPGSGQDCDLRVFINQSSVFAVAHFVE